MTPPRIVSAQPIDDLTLSVKFTNNEFRKYDISNPHSAGNGMSKYT